MAALSDALIDQLANQMAPHAYSYEVKAMAQEILEYRRKAAEAAKAAKAAAHQTSKTSSVPWPYGGMFP